MKTRLTANSRSNLPDDESLDNFPSTSTVEPSATTVSVEPLPTTVSAESEITSKTKSNVWQHFEWCLVVGPLKAKCSLCQEELLTPNYATSSLKRHLVQRHGLKQFSLKEVSSSSSSSININLSKIEKQKLDSLAVDAIIKDSRAFGHLQKSGLKKLIDALRPGYKAPHRNFVVKKLKRLNEKHTAQTKVEFEEATFLSITCDFWTNRQQKSFLVITGHYVDKKFNEHSKILKFITFEERHYSIIIAQEIEKQLIGLGLYDKLVTITCDGAYNMRRMFTYFSRRNIKYIHCVAHKFHLVICNSLNLWTMSKKKRKTTNTDETAEVSTDEDDNDNDSQAALNTMIRTMSVDIDHLLNENNNTDNDDETNDTSQEYDNIQDESQSDDGITDAATDEEYSIDEDHDQETTDNFVEGVNTAEVLLDDLQQKVWEVILIVRDVVNTTKKTSILSNFVEKKRLYMNLHCPKNKTLKRRLYIDVRTRWNSTYKMLFTMNLYRDIINDLFKSKGSLGLTAKQRRKLARIELSTDQCDFIELIIALLQPFYSATKVLSNTKYPTIGSSLYIIQSLAEHLQKDETNPMLHSLKSIVLTEFQKYMFDDIDQFNTLKLYGYLDPMVFSALTKAEQTAIEKQLTTIYKKEFEPPVSSSSSTITSRSSSTNTRQTVTKMNNIDKAWHEFLKATSKDPQHEAPTTTTIQSKIKCYRNLATKLYV